MTSQPPPKPSSKTPKTPKKTLPKPFTLKIEPGTLVLILAILILAPLLMTGFWGQ